MSRKADETIIKALQSMLTLMVKSPVPTSYMASPHGVENTWTASASLVLGWDPLMGSLMRRGSGKKVETREYGSLAHGDGFWFLTLFDAFPITFLCDTSCFPRRPPRFAFDNLFRHVSGSPWTLVSSHSPYAHFHVLLRFLNYIRATKRA